MIKWPSMIEQFVKLRNLFALCLIIMEEQTIKREKHRMRLMLEN